MRDALDLLRTVTDRLPPTPGQRHSLTMLDGALYLNIFLRGSSYLLEIDDADMLKAPEQIVNEIAARRRLKAR